MNAARRRLDGDGRSTAVHRAVDFAVAAMDRADGDGMIDVEAPGGGAGVEGEAEAGRQIQRDAAGAARQRPVGIRLAANLDRSTGGARGERAVGAADANLT